MAPSWLRNVSSSRPTVVLHLRIYSQERDELRRYAGAQNATVTGLVRAIVHEKLEEARRRGHLHIDLGELEVAIDRPATR